MIQTFWTVYAVLASGVAAMIVARGNKIWSSHD